MSWLDDFVDTVDDEPTIPRLQTPSAGARAPEFSSSEVTSAPQELSWVDNFFGPAIVKLGALFFAKRPILELVAGEGVGIAVEDDSAGKATKVTITNDGEFDPPTGTGLRHGDGRRPRSRRVGAWDRSPSDRETVRRTHRPVAVERGKDPVLERHRLGERCARLQPRNHHASVRRADEPSTWGRRQRRCERRYELGRRRGGRLDRRLRGGLHFGGTQYGLRKRILHDRRQDVDRLQLCRGRHNERRQL